MQNPENLVQNTEFIDTSDESIIQAAMVSVLRELVNDETQKETWERFRYSFEARRQVPWLGESMTTEHFLDRWEAPHSIEIKSELSGGIIDAFITASSWMRSPISPILIERNEKDGMRASIDQDFIHELNNALDILEQLPPNNVLSPWGLIGRYYDNVQISVDRFNADLQNSLTFYWICTYSLGYGGDPW